MSSWFFRINIRVTYKTVCSKNKKMLSASLKTYVLIYILIKQKLFSNKRNQRKLKYLEKLMFRKYFIHSFILIKRFPVKRMIKN